MREEAREREKMRETGKRRSRVPAGCDWQEKKWKEGKSNTKGEEYRTYSRAILD